jgi:hypothetical protein
LDEPDPRRSSECRKTEKGFQTSKTGIPDIQDLAGGFQTSKISPGIPDIQDLAGDSRHPRSRRGFQTSKISPGDSRHPRSRRGFQDSRHPGFQTSEISPGIPGIQTSKISPGIPDIQDLAGDSRESRGIRTSKISPVETIDQRIRFRNVEAVGDRASGFRGHYT